MKNSTGIDVLAISLGDPAGIGSEITFSALADKSIYQNTAIIIFGDRPALANFPSIIIELDFEFKRNELQAGEIYFVNVTGAKDDCSFGTPTAESGSRSMAYLTKAVETIISGKADALTTAPISKEAWHMAGFNYPGHTELLQIFSGATRTEMAFLSSELSVVLFTTHLSMVECIEKIKKDALVNFFIFVSEEFKKIASNRPRIWVTGLNAHAGENGMFGAEEKDEIIPAIEYCRELGLDIHGPFPADTMFHEKARDNYDIAVAMYHDQGLIPVKTIAFEEAVNFTLGLPFIRTSPAHGTAFGLAGKGKADPSGMKSAITTALKLLRNSI